MLALQFAMKLYQTRMEFRRLQYQGIVCPFPRRRNFGLTRPANHVSISTFRPLSCRISGLPRLGLQRKFNPDVWFLYD
jgi:hypothetical protein